MEKMITGELSKTLILLGMGVVSVTAVLARLITKVRGSFKPYQKATLLYLLVSFLFFGLIAGTAYWLVLKSYMTFYMLYQLYFLILGIVHVNYMQRYLKWSGDSKAYWLELIFTIVAGGIGGIGFLLVYRWFNQEGMEYDMVMSITSFIVPWFVNQTYQRAIAIPPKVIKQWYYPVAEEVEEPDESKLKNLLVISFEFKKQVNDPHVTNFRAKAPTDMEFGELFYYFVNDYNERHPNSRIQFIDNSGEPTGWIFYKKPKWHTLITQYIDAGKTIYINGVKENDVIICSRSGD